jgi:hypothetical protein
MKDAGHFFLKCKEVKLVWQKMNLMMEREQLATCSSVGIVIDELWKHPEEMRIKNSNHVVASTQYSARRGALPRSS